MTTSRSELFGSARRRKNGGRKASGWKLAGVLFVVWTVTAIASSAQTFRIVKDFSEVTGVFPQAPLVEGLDGNLYGTTEMSGPLLEGTVFRITPNGTLTTLYNFCSATYSCDDGNGPVGLVQAIDGNLYGTTNTGGASRGGTVFKITPRGTLTTLYSFPEGTGERKRLMQATDGNFYGTTLNGGSHNRGTVFKITPGGTLTTLYTFCAQANCIDGAAPAAGLMQATDGNFYGTTDNGGSHNSGTVFKITPGGTLTTLYSFCAQATCADGARPAGLVQGTDGNFYGTTIAGGATESFCYRIDNGCGTVFRITPSGTLTTLHSFDGTDGDGPAAGLVQGTDGNFYGTTLTDGAYTGGTVFKITPRGALTTLHSFNNSGGSPSAWLMQATNGTFYGTTSGGGAYGSGMIFSLCVGLGWFAETLPTFGTVGATIQILGTNFIGATGVTFNGTPAPFTVVSSTQIQTTVPTGATTGSVKMTIPSGTLTSNKRFRVLPQITSFSPTSGPPGTVVTITGVSLSQTIWASIGGVGANFTVLDDTTVTATVPTGATTGRTINITTRGGRITSATTFTVQ